MCSHWRYAILTHSKAVRTAKLENWKLEIRLDPLSVGKHLSKALDVSCRRKIIRL